MYEVDENNRAILVIATTWSDRRLFYGPFPDEHEAIHFMMHTMTHQENPEDEINGFTMQFMNRVAPPWDFNQVAMPKVT